MLVAIPRNLFISYSPRTTLSCIASIDALKPRVFISQASDENRVLFLRRQRCWKVNGDRCEKIVACHRRRIQFDKSKYFRNKNLLTHFRPCFSLFSFFFFFFLILASLPWVALIGTSSVISCTLYPLSFSFFFSFLRLLYVKSLSLFSFLESHINGDSASDIVSSVWHERNFVFAFPFLRTPLPFALN